MQKDRSEVLLGKKKEAKRIQPLLKIRSPISSNIKRSKDSKPITNGLESLETFNLYSIKLGLIRELISLSSKYQSSNSTQARFSKILNLSRTLDSLLQISKERIRTDTKFRDTLTQSLKDLEVTEAKAKNTVLEVLNDDDSIKICGNVSGVYCVAFISANRNFSQFDIEIHGEMENAKYSYHLLQSIKAQQWQVETVLASAIMNHMYFNMLQGRLVLRFREKIDNEEVLVASIQGIGPKTCVVLKEFEEFYEIRVEGKRLELKKANLKIRGLSEMRNSGIRDMVRRVLERDLSFVMGELSWGLSSWEISTSIHKKNCSSLFKTQFMERKDKLEPFENVMVRGEVMVKDSSVKVELIFNSFLQKSRVMIYLGDASVKVLEEENVKEFKAMKKMQNAKICSVTMMKSLELAAFVNKYFFY